MKLCDYGCGQEAKYKFKNGRWCCSKYTSNCPIMSMKIKKLYQDPNSKYNSISCREKRSDSMKEVWIDPNSAFHSKEFKKKRKEASKGDKNGMYNKKQSIKTRLLIGDSEKGEKHHHYGKTGSKSYLWKGGSRSYLSVEMKKYYKECVLCKSNIKLEMHHKDHNIKNNKRTNRIIICMKCHDFWHKN